MENVSKFLLIAGGILITMITISVFYLMFDKSGDVADAMQANTTQKELVAFNTGFEAYNKKIMYGVDVISVINKAIDNNKDYYGTNLYDDYYVDIEFKYNGKTLNLKENESEIVKDYTSKVAEKDNNEIHNFKFAAFKCTGVKYVKSSDIKKQSASDATRKNLQNDIRTNHITN